MKKSVILILILTSVTYGQQLGSPFGANLPSPGPTGSVTLPLSEYNRLIELAARKPKTSETPPLPYVLSRALFRLRVEGQSLVGEVEIEGAVLEKGFTKVPLTTGLTILEAKQAGSTLPLIQEGTTHSAVLNGPGRFAVSLNVASALTVEAGRASFVLPVPAASSSLLSLDLAGSHPNVKVEPGLITSRTTSSGHTVTEATLEPGKPTRVWWTTREVAAPVAQRDVRFLSDVKTVVTIGDSQLRITALCDLTIVQGETAEFKISLPPGFELTEVTGSTLDSSEKQGETLILNIREPARRNHQFLVAIERANRETKLAVPLLAVAGAQRETGELLVEGVGAIDMTPKESGGLRRMDVREVTALARSLARYPLQAAFRYNRRPTDMPKLDLEWSQFPDSRVLSAIAERATVTTLTNVEGKSLTEVSLRVRNHAQLFVRVQLPPGASLFSAEVEGVTVKPMEGPDGNRVPLLRTGLNTSAAYTVSFVYLNSGPRFVNKGAYEMALPKLDIPVNILTWEISLPGRIEVKQFGGNALAAELFPTAAQFALAGADENFGDTSLWDETGIELDKLEPGQVGGIVVDPNGAVVAGASITVVNSQTGTTQTTRANAEGRWAVSNIPPGAVKVTVSAPGFANTQHDLQLAETQPVRLGTTLTVASVSQVVQVTGGRGIDSRRVEEVARRSQQAQLNAPSQNVMNLQRRVAGIMPVKVDVPRAGLSYRFVRPLVLEEETRVSFQYKAR